MDTPILLLSCPPKTSNAGNFYFELRRKLFHLAFGLLLIFILLYSGRASLIIFLSIVLFFGSIMIVLMQKDRKIPIADWLEETFERKDVRFPGYGAFWYVVGSLLSSLFLNDVYEIAATIMVLAAGDFAATIFGVLGRHPLPHNRQKTWEGSLAFFVFSLPACLFVDGIGIALAAVAAIVESISSPVDDNLSIPVAAMIFFIIA